MVKNKLKFYRTMMCMTQADLAKKSGMSQQAISNFESQFRQPSIENAFVFVKLFDITLNDFYFEE